MLLQRAITNLVLDPAMIDRESWSITLAAIESILVGRAIFPDKKPLHQQNSRTASCLQHEPDLLDRAQFISNTALIAPVQHREGAAVIQSAPVTKDVPRTSTHKSMLLSQLHSRRSNIKTI
jgi:hypothetical protein